MAVPPPPEPPRTGRSDDTASCSRVPDRSDTDRVKFSQVPWRLGALHIRQVPLRTRKLEIVFDIPQSRRSFTPCSSVTHRPP